MLGDMTPGRDGIRRFRKESSMVLVNEQAWRGQFEQAARDARMLVNINAILPPRTILPASYHIYTRHYSQVKTDYFESFRKGTILTMIFRIEETMAKAPTLDQFTTLLSLVGTWLGLSPWGSKFNFGRFEVLDTHVVEEKNNEQSTIQTDCQSD
jgi:hypothetical protein